MADTCPACKAKPMHGILPMCLDCWARVPEGDQIDWDIRFQKLEWFPTSNFARAPFDRLTNRIIEELQPCTTSKC